MSGRMAEMAASLAASAADCLGSCGSGGSGGSDAGISSAVFDASIAAVREVDGEVAASVSGLIDVSDAGAGGGDLASVVRAGSFESIADAFCNGASAGFVGDDEGVVQAASISDEAMGAATDQALGHMDGSW